MLGQRGFELEVGPRHVAAAAHRHATTAVFDHRVGQGREAHLPPGVAEVDRERELADLHRVGRAHRVEVGELAVFLTFQFLLADLGEATRRRRR